VRVIAATNCDIEEEVRQKRFRQDLMYRLNAVMIHLPPLRERVEDIPLLAGHFARQIRPADASPIRFSPAAIEIMKDYKWQGNVRELENAVCHAVSLCGDVVYPQHLPARLLQVNESATEQFQNIEMPATQNNEWFSLAEMEAKYVTQVLAHTNGNKQAAARLLNIDPKTLASVIKRSET
jgi:DNA-binding NtrC family response regulator